MDPGSTGPTKFSLKKLILIAVLAGGLAAFFYLDLGRFLTLDALKENKDALRDFTDVNYGTMVILFVAVYCLQTAFSFPGATVFTLAGGFLFGTLLGTLYVNIAATAGATLAFLAARYLFRDAVERRLGERLSAIHRGLERNAFNYLLTLRLIPIFPFFLINLGFGLTRIPLGTYVVATAVGIIPGTFVYANAGKQLGTIESVGDIASPGVLGAFVLLGLLALVPILYQKFRKSPVPGTDPPQ